MNGMRASRRVGPGLGMMVLACVAALWSGLAAAAEAPGNLTAQDLQRLLPELRKGGHVLYFRHGLTQLDQQDRHPVAMGDCATQRNLSDEGRRQASVIGEVVRKVRIPVGSVYASPFCRTMQTAKAAFGRADAVDDLASAVSQGKAERERRGLELRRMLGQVPANGGNTVIVAHSTNLEEAIGFWPKPEGAAIVFRPDGHGGYQALGRITVETWQELVAAR